MISDAPVTVDTPETASRRLPAIGLGTTSLGGMFESVSADTAQQVFDLAYQRGIRYIDTAPMYGLSLAERRLGSFLDRVRDETVMVSTKVGRVVRPRRLIAGGGEADLFGWADTPDFAADYDYSYDGVMRSIEDSLQRLGRTQVDVIYLHDIGRGNHGEANDRYVAQLRGGGYRAMAELKQSGVTSALGIGVNDAEAVIETIGEIDLDWCLLANHYTLLEHEDASGLFEQCARRDVHLVAGGVFNSGVLAGSAHYRYGDAPEWVRTRVAALREVCGRFDVALPAAAIQFVERSGRFDTVLIGPRSVDELAQILEWRDALIPDELWSALVDASLIDEEHRPASLRLLP